MSKTIKLFYKTDDTRELEWLDTELQHILYQNGYKLEQSEFSTITEVKWFRFRPMTRKEIIEEGLQGIA